MKFLGLFVQRPYASAFSFTVDGEPYAVCLTYWDDTLTEDEEMFDTYQMDLFKVKKINYGTVCKHMIDNVILGDKVKEVSFKFNKLFPDVECRAGKKDYVNPKDSKDFLERENKIIHERLLMPSFSSIYHVPLQKMMNEHLVFELDRGQFDFLSSIW